MTTVAQAVGAFLDYAADVRRLSPHTIDAYRRDLAALVSAVGERAPAEVPAVELRRLLAARRGAKPASVSRQLAAWRAFYDYLIAAGAAEVNPARALAAPKMPARLPKALTPDEMNALLAPAPADWLERRDAAIMELLYSSALRLEELTRLDLNDVDVAAGQVHIRRGKGGRGRVAPLGRVAAQALGAWLVDRRALLDGAAQPALFVGRNGRRLGARAIQLRIGRHVQKTSVAKAVSPHVFRHSCASHFLQSSGDLRATQELLGHKDIAATQLYTRLDFQHLAGVYDKAHPRARRPASKRSNAD